MRKIGIVSEYFYPHLGGITEHVYHYAKELIARGFDVSILTGYEGEKPGISLPEKLKIIHLGRSVPFYSNHSFAKVTLGWNLGKKIKRLLQEEQFDILHVHSPTLPVLPALFQKYTTTITVGTLHSYFESAFFYKLFRKVGQDYLDQLHGLIAVSPSCIQAVSRYLNIRHPYRIIPNGIDIDWFSKPSNNHNQTDRIEPYNDGSPNILFLGRLDPRNGLDTLIAAFPHVLKRVPKARLIIVGDGPLRPIYEHKAGVLKDRRIFFEGCVNEKRPAYFATSTVFCYPATKASFGITLLEAMAAGVPVVATDNIGFRELVRHNENGLLVPPDHPVAIAEALCRVIENPLIARELVNRATHRVQQFSWSRVTEQVLDFYNTLFLKEKGIPFAA